MNPRVVSEFLGEFFQADNRALNVPKEDEQSVEKLSAYLTQWTTFPMLQVRAIFRWITGSMTGNLGDFHSQCGL